jgi:hypothetical protein
MPSNSNCSSDGVFFSDNELTWWCLCLTIGKKANLDWRIDRIEETKCLGETVGKRNIYYHLGGEAAQRATLFLDSRFWRMPSFISTMKPELKGRTILFSFDCSCSLRRRRKEAVVGWLARKAAIFGLDRSKFLSKQYRGRIRSTNKK